PRHVRALARVRQGRALRLRASDPAGHVLASGQQPAAEAAARGQRRRHAASLQALRHHRRHGLSGDPPVGEGRGEAMSRALLHPRLAAPGLLGALALATLAPARATASDKAPLEALNPDLAAHPYQLDPGVYPFEHRLAVCPAFGFLGSERLFAMRIEYCPA